MKIRLDTSPRGVHLDLDVLLRTRLLVQANSGGGKSWLLRVLAERLFGHVQVILLDPEGEFATLREKHDYVLVGKGGETPADVRSAALIARRLLELRASAVCDLYEMKPGDRHRWVKLFLDAMIDAPKDLWHPVVVVVDEAHSFCPEKSDSEASESMISLATRGRKRGFAAVFATQRLSKLDKDAAAELSNVLLGRTFIDVDRDRAADALGVARAERHDFDAAVKVLPDGDFYALGPALSLERRQFHVRSVETTHPEAGSAKHAAAPPPPPEKIKRLLPQLADLPKEAESKARTEAELRQEIIGLRREVELARKTARVEFRDRPAEKIEVPVLKDAQLERLEKAWGKMVAWFESLPLNPLKQVAADISLAIDTAHKARLHKEGGGHSERLVAPVPMAAAQHDARTTGPQMPRAVTKVPSSPAAREPSIIDADFDDFDDAHRNILNALAWLAALGVAQPSKAQVAGVAKRRPTSGAWFQDLADLVRHGYVTYPTRGTVALTDAGRACAIPPDLPPTGGELRERVLGTLDDAQRAILERVIEHYPNAIDKTALAAEVPSGSNGETRKATSGAWFQDLADLRTLGVVTYPARGTIRAADILFPDAP